MKMIMGMGTAWLLHEYLSAVNKESGLWLPNRISST